MIIKIGINDLRNMIKLRRTFILCTYHIDDFSLIYQAKLKQELKRKLINIYFLSVKDYNEYFQISNKIYPIFILFKEGFIMWKKCGFITSYELFECFTQKNIITA